MAWPHGHPAARAHTLCESIELVVRGACVLAATVGTWHMAVAEFQYVVITHMHAVQTAMYRFGRISATHSQLHAACPRPFPRHLWLQRWIHDISLLPHTWICVSRSSGGVLVTQQLGARKNILLGLGRTAHTAT